MNKPLQIAEDKTTATGQMTEDGAVAQVTVIGNILLVLSQADPDRGDTPLILEWLGYRLDDAATVLRQAGVSP